MNLKTNYYNNYSVITTRIQLAKKLKKQLLNLTIAFQY